jgi:hypothetical protein
LSQNPKEEEQKKHTYTPKSPRTKSPKSGVFFVVVFPTFLFLHTHTHTNKQTNKQTDRMKTNKVVVNFPKTCRKLETNKKVKE